MILPDYQNQLSKNMEFLRGITDKESEAVIFKHNVLYPGGDDK